MSEIPKPPVNISAESAETFNSRLGSASSQEHGWSFSAGNPEFWKFLDKLLVPNGHVLDLGTSQARSSFIFALHGMKVTGFDSNQKDVIALRQLAKEYQLPIHAYTADLQKLQLPENAFNLVILDQTFHHFPNKKDAYEVLEKALKAIEPNGYIWLRAIGKESEYYEEMRYLARACPQQVQIADKDVIHAPCSCSGEMKIEPYLFFDQTELLEHFCTQGLRIVHTNLSPEKGRMNIMYGEDWATANPGFEAEEGEKYGLITLLAQKTK